MHDESFFDVGAHRSQRGRSRDAGARAAPRHPAPAFALPGEGCPQAAHAPTASYSPTGGCNTPLVYYGGPIMAKPDVVQVSWNDPTSSVASSIETYLSTWWPAIVSQQANYLSLLDQYSTVGVAAKDGNAGSNQTFAGYGTYHGLYKITPAAANQGASVDDSAIGPEIVAQIKAGKLPTPQFDANGFSNTIYMVDFPPSVTSITMTFAGSTISSCNDFCGYHAGTQYSTGKYIYYGVHPDVTTGTCATNCIVDGQDQDVAMVHSHELAEATTDAEIFLEPLTASSTDFVRPGAWDNYTGGCSEIGDSCAWPSEVGAAVPTVTYNGASYYVQGLFNNALLDCEWQGSAAPPSCTTNTDCTNPDTPVCKTGTCVASGLVGHRLHRQRRGQRLPAVGGVRTMLRDESHGLRGARSGVQHEQRHLRRVHEQRSVLGEHAHLHVGHLWALHVEQRVLHAHPGVLDERRLRPVHQRLAVLGLEAHLRRDVAHVPRLRVELRLRGWHEPRVRHRQRTVRRLRPEQRLHDGRLRHGESLVRAVPEQLRVQQPAARVHRQRVRRVHVEQRLLGELEWQGVPPELRLRAVRVELRLPQRRDVHVVAHLHREREQQRRGQREQQRQRERQQQRRR